MSSLKLFHTTNSGVTEVTPRLAEAEADVQDLIEAHMETMLGVRFLASEYVIDCVDGGRIDSLGLDENNAPVIVEYKRGTNAGVINQGLYYMAWLMAHKNAFRSLVRDRLGAPAASQILWSAPRLICVAGDFTRYDAHAVREHRRSIDLVRYRYFGSDLIGLETVASVTGHTSTRRLRRRAAGTSPARNRGGACRSWRRRSTRRCSAWGTASPGSSASSTRHTSGCGTSPASARRSRPSSSSTSRPTRSRSTWCPASPGT